MKKLLGWMAAPAIAAVALFAAAAPAEARVSLSVGISLPVAPGLVVGGVVSNRHYWRPPVLVAPAPLIYPAPVIYPSPVVYRGYAPRPRAYYAPYPRYYRGGPPHAVPRPGPGPIGYRAPGDPR